VSTAFQYTAVASPLTDQALVESIVSRLDEALTSAGGERVEPQAASRQRPLVVLVATGGVERDILYLYRLRAQSFPQEPVILVAHPEANSLGSALEALAKLRDDGRWGRVVFVGSDGGGELAEIAPALGAWERLRSTRIGLVGAPSDWLVASTPDPSVIRSVWGPATVRIDMGELEHAIASPEDPSAPAEVAADFARSAERVCEPDPAAMERAGAVYAALREIVGRHSLDAVSVRCFDLATLRGTTACLALSRLADEGIVAGCEGDLVSAVAMLWARVLLGVVPWMANPAMVDPAHGRVVLAHCTVPRSLAPRYEIRSHFETGAGAAVGGDVAPGPVTLVRLGGRRLERIWLAEGQAAAAERSETRCRTQVEVSLTGGDTVGHLLRAPLGNHIVLIPGAHAAWLADSREIILGSGGAL
jgi:L-fucose isomerase-like protein